MPPPQRTATLRLAQGAYLGEVIPRSAQHPRAIQAFRGIPYAQSTAGANRFRPPRPLDEPGSGAKSDVVVHRALAFGDICPQGGAGHGGQSEDCLNANVFRPHFDDDDDEGDGAAHSYQRPGPQRRLLPIVVYIHGGGFNSGWGGERDMGSFAAWAAAPLVAVSFNYRVGALGFPSGAHAPAGLLVNLGLRDQRCLLGWVRANAAALGGDPDNVTVMGLSAGAHSIGHHLIAYAPANNNNRTTTTTRGGAGTGIGTPPPPPPFQKAILESGAATARAVFVPDHPLHVQQWEEFLMHCGLEDDDISSSSDDDDEDALLAALQALPLDVVAAAQHQVWNKWSPTLRWPFQPVVDGPGGMVPDLPVNSWAKGNVLRIPILTGFNTNEGAVFVPQRASSPSALRALVSSLVPAMGAADLASLERTLYPDPTSTAAGRRRYGGARPRPPGCGPQFWRLDDAYSDYAYVCPVLQTATLAATLLSAADADADADADVAPPVYAYHFAATRAARGAADHGDEAAVVAHDMGAIGAWPGLVATADAMNGAWTRFAATGDPNLYPASSNQTANEITTESSSGNFTWPRFRPPPLPSSISRPILSSGAGGRIAAAGAGRIALFGKGNDERGSSSSIISSSSSSKSRSRGTPAQVVALTDRELRACHFWWDRVALSEGRGTGAMGNGSSSGAAAVARDEDGDVKAKL
ncbi:carboxylesterase 3 [Xylariaceae sp. FL0804]|nr:carboxylesterase 3 [Xylariaceae sp. FL0804]